MGDQIKFFEDLPKKTVQGFQWIFADIDDTITTQGKLSAEAYSALWSLKKSGRQVVLVTGRPAGWAESMARFWPLDAIVCENGALVFALQGNSLNDSSSGSSKPPQMQRIFVAAQAKKEKSQRRLRALWQELQRALPHLQLAADQDFRLFDLAIDLCEEVEPVSDKDIRMIEKSIQDHKLQYKISSIHINIWAGDYSKEDGIKAALSNVWSEKLSEILDSAIYFGDSPNDEPLFRCFKHSVGVRNIEKFLPSLESKPTYLTRSEEGRGFSDAISRILED